MKKFRTLNADEIKVRIGNVSQKGTTLLLYTEARTVMDILDETVGPENWESDYKDIKGNLYGGIGIYDPETGRETWKWDCGTESFSEAAKGESSDAFKRASVKWQIARELYRGPKIFVECPTRQKSDGKGYEIADNETKNKLQFRTQVTDIKYDDDRNITAITIRANYFNGREWVDEVVYSYPKGKEAVKAEPKKEVPKVDKSVKISKGQKEMLTMLMNQTQSDWDGMLAYYKVESVDEMTVEQFEHCASALQNKLGKTA